jgi:uncharacterized Zn-binding protein involved in type VI secretion
MKRLVALKADQHACPLCDFGKPHRGGVIESGAASVRIGARPIARQSDWCSCDLMTTWNAVDSGCGEVLVCGLPVARVSDKTAHGGMILKGDDHHVYVCNQDKPDAIDLAIDRLAATPWGQTDDGRRIIDKLRAMQAAGAIRYGDLPEDCHVVQDEGHLTGGPCTWVGGKYRPEDQTILVNGVHRDDVDTIALVLAHEGQHAQDHEDGAFQKDDNERALERRGWDTESEVWKQQRDQGSNVHDRVRDPAEAYEKASDKDRALDDRLGHDF